MNRNFPKFIILALGAFVGLSACNSSTTQQEVESVSQLASSTIVKGFSLRSNPKVLANLDSVFFSIDQVKAEIYNADSLPWGTDVRKLVLNVQIPSTSSVEVIMPNLTDGSDTVINLLQNSADSINFSRGRVWMRVGSQNGEFERIYSVKVNVHACKADSLQWSAECRSLPSSLGALKSQRAVEFKGKYYSLASNGQSMQLAVADDPAQAAWTLTDVTGAIAVDADVNSLTATDDALYLLTASGTLLTSGDGLSWTVATEGWSHIYGAYGKEVVGVSSSRWICFPSGESGEIPAGMPVKGTSQMWTFTNEWAIEPQAMTVGGILADGTYTGAAWGFDGMRWMQLSNAGAARTLPAAAGYQLFPYFTFRTNNRNFQVTRQSTWIAFGGSTADGRTPKTVYISLDSGLNWLEAPEGLQLPAGVAPRSGATVVLHDRVFTAASRAVKPITEWDAPYIFLFGGYSASGALLNEMWTGVINRLTFKPLQ